MTATHRRPSAPAMSAGTAETAGLGAKPASAVRGAEAPEATTPHPGGGAVEAGEDHPCPHCRRRLSDRSGLYCHIAQAHGHRKARLAVPDHPSVVRERQRRERAQRNRSEPSMADLAIEASIARAIGEAVDPDIAEMFDV